MTLLELKKRVAFLAQDPTMRVIPAAQYVDFINDAVRDLRTQGWLLPISEDTSLTMAASIYDYAIPANFAYLHDVREQSDTTPATYDIIVPEHQYRLAYISNAPYLSFNSGLWYPRAGKTFKLVGQKRPTTYSLDADVIEGEFEGVVRERAAAYALMHHAAMYEPHLAEYVQEIEGESPPGVRTPAVAQGILPVRIRVLLQVAQMHFANAEKMMTQHPSEFRVQPDGKHIPGR